MTPEHTTTNGAVTIILPVFNDWASLSELLKDLNSAAGENGRRFSILVVNDGSTDLPPDDFYALGVLANFDSIEIVELALNMGHQRALAIGICAALEDTAAGQFVIMDADGEDRPRDIRYLLQSAAQMPRSIAVAQRRRRNEKFAFRTFYKAYKLAFFLLTGKEISFGNFCLLSREHAARLSMVPDLWNNLPAAVMRSRLPIERVPIDRGHRYIGSSKMSFVSLSLHGMSAYSVYTDAILVRLLIVTFCLGGVGAVLVLAAAILRLFTTSLATPGWATTVFFGTAIIFSQAVFTTLMSALLLLNNRSQKLVIPIIECKHYIRCRREIPFHSAALLHEASRESRSESSMDVISAPRVRSGELS